MVATGLVVVARTVAAGLGETVGCSSLRDDPLVVFQYDLACQVVSGQARKRRSASPLPMSVLDV